MDKPERKDIAGRILREQRFEDTLDFINDCFPNQRQHNAKMLLVALDNRGLIDYKKVEAPECKKEAPDA